MPLLSHLFISKKRILPFEIKIFIEDLTNVPLVSGLYYVKWKITNATNGSTRSAPIRDHTIYWGSHIDTEVQLVVSKQQNMLESCDLKLEVYQELRKETTLIGNLVINLSEYAATTSARRYLLDHCKFNSTIKLSISVKQKTETILPFNTPPLKRQQIFIDIPTMFHEDSFDKRSLHSAHSSSSSSNLLSLSHRSHSTKSLPLYFKQFTNEPFPTDLVEQLFKQPK